MPMKKRYQVEVAGMLRDLDRKLKKILVAIPVGGDSKITLGNHKAIEELASIARDIELSSAIYLQLNYKEG